MLDMSKHYEVILFVNIMLNTVKYCFGFCILLAHAQLWYDNIGHYRIFHYTNNCLQLYNCIVIHLTASLSKGIVVPSCMCMYRITF